MTARLALALAVGATALSACNAHECDPATYEGGCDGNRYSVCWRTANAWVGEQEELIERECAADEVCVESGPNAAACVLAPATRCDPSSHVGRCVGSTPVVCSAPASWLQEDYEIRGSPCDPAPCVVTEAGAGCREGSEPCPLPAGDEHGCLARERVDCWFHPGEGRSVVAARRACEHDCVEMLDMPICY